MATQRPWSKDAERKWRSTFTRENREGERLLSYKFRHGETPASLIRAEKANYLAKEAKEDMAVRAEARWGVIDAIPKIGAAKGETLIQDLDYKVRAGIKSRTIYLGNRKIEQTFDEIGNLVAEEEVTL